ncbi:hypothetical protein DCAR_0103083 [Daucus carota subsp. sativus]|uniref:Glycoside hydrolase family 19 catalytic domain-containing protein n=1 Tax=Daucus carota subsp. sativus TaxID=79200 RepID=A0AAF0W9J1_DAUCS|nr:hypothetical protein DCAR_0103083 [Daucus carota subsp. sativus]
MAPPLSIPLLLLTILVFSSTLFSSSEARNGIKISSLISQDLYNSIFLHKDDSACPAKDFYPYSAFIEATERFPRFGSCGSLATRKREIAAFLAQISHETTGGPGSDYCDSSNQQWPCYPNKTYQGRGPIQLSWNYNYGPAGKALGFDGLRTPEIVANNSVIAFKTALWFWMTEQKPKPSCHDVMIGRYKPTAADIAANRTAGFGLVTNIINGGLECGIGSDSRVNDRIGFFQRYAKLFNVDTGSNLDCASQKSF